MPVTQIVETLELTLPWPPSANTYWRRVGRKVLISADGRAYRQVIAALIWRAGRPRIEGRLGLYVITHQDDLRERDLDNLPKAVQDSLQHAGVFERDSQIDDTHWVRGAVAQGDAYLALTLRRLESDVLAEARAARRRPRRTRA
jgi:crossover junction endodeoxyribonuclease RusA